MSMGPVTGRRSTTNMGGFPKALPMSAKMRSVRNRVQHMLSIRLKEKGHGVNTCQGDRRRSLALQIRQKPASVQRGESLEVGVDG